ncbi:MAG: hypothetical protein ACM3X4_00595 [Ignavibacteriales bacterium]
MSTKTESHSVPFRGSHEPPRRPTGESEAGASSRRPWYWEGSIQARLATYLAGRGYKICSVAHTASKEHGIDIVAAGPDGVEIWISVKGFPESSANTQARHWFAQAVFDVALCRSQNASVRLALGLPDGFPTYERLASRIGWLRTTLPLTIYWVGRSGAIREE